MSLRDLRIRRILAFATLMTLCVTAAGAPPASDLASASDRMLASKGKERGELACSVLRGGVLREVFGAEAGAAELSPGGPFVPHGLCTATWDKPDADALREARTRHQVEKMKASMGKRSFDEPTPPAPNYSVSLTLLMERFDSPAAAVTSLENAVKQLTEGITVEVAGRKRRTQVDFDDWIDGLGDRAIWAPKMSELSVANNGYRFAIGVSGFGDADVNRERAEALARRLIGSR